MGQPARRILDAFRAGALGRNGKLGMWECDVRSGVTHLSESWARMLGYSLAELEPHTQDTWRSLTHPADLAAAETTIERCFTGEAVSFETSMRMLHREGHWVWILGRGHVIERDEDGQPARVAGMQVAL